MSSTLSLVATPIGNLKDISLRAIETLQQADVIACEDTRHTAILCKTYDITAPLVSYTEQKRGFRDPQLIERLQQGQSVALVSDAGMPGINDPGASLVRQAIAAGIPVTVVPGPSAGLSALALSGMPTDRFVCEGFLPHKSSQRRKRLADWRAEERTIVCYESPHRLAKALADIAEVLGDIPVVCVRELTKLYEQVQRGTAKALAGYWSQHAPRGEYVLVLRNHVKHPSDSHH